MSRRRVQAFRGVRKTAHISRRLFSKAAHVSGRVEQKVDRIIKGTDSTIKLHNKVLFEKVYSEALPEITPIYPALPLAGRMPAVTILVPSLQKSSFFGGIATALILAGKLSADKGLPLRIVETIKHGNAQVEQLVDFFESNNIGLGANKIKLIDLSPRTYNNYGYLDIHPDDIYIASAWWDAYILDRLPLLRPYVYLIQDYEPIFYNNSDRSVLAESTYHSEKFIPVCNTNLMRDFMSQKGYKHISKSALYFEPAVNISNKSNPRPRTTDKRRLFLYGRPSVDRNLFYLALSCLDELFIEQSLDINDWELYMAGQDSLTDIVLETGIVIHNLGKMSLPDYYDFVGTVDIAFSPMLAPHPNYPTLEFASSGVSVVTTTYETKQDLSSYSKNIIIAPADPKSLKIALVKAAGMSAAEKQENAKNSSIGSDWHSALESVVRDLAARLTV